MSPRLFVTGKLAANSLRDTLDSISLDFAYDVLTLGISVAALMNTEFLKKHLPPCHQYSQVVLPGLCRADTRRLTEIVGAAVVRGPKDLKDLPAFYREDGLDQSANYNASPPTPLIIAEIVDAPYLSTAEIMNRASYYKATGADIIDLGCCIEKDFPHLEQVIERLKDTGLVVSLDSFQESEIIRGMDSGVDIILSLNSSNIHLAPRLTCPAVIIPDSDYGLDSLEQNLARAHAAGLNCILDPILNPINFGFIPSLQRFVEARRRFPNLPFLMGIGNITELTDADSTGINALLMGIAHELKIDYVLTTEASSRTRGAVQEAALARHLIYEAQIKGSPPKNFSADLLTVKDKRLYSFSPAELRQMQQLITDRNFRIFTAADRIFVFNRDLFISGTNPAELYARLGITDPDHAFYMGSELHKAQLALQLGKKYIQEQELNWGYLSPEYSQFGP